VAQLKQHHCQMLLLLGRLLVPLRCLAAAAVAVGVVVDQGPSQLLLLLLLLLPLLQVLLEHHLAMEVQGQQRPLQLPWEHPCQLDLLLLLVVLH